MTCDIKDSLPKGNDISKDIEHLVRSAGLVDTFDDGVDELVDGTLKGRPLHLVVPPLQQMEQSLGCGRKE